MTHITIHGRRWFQKSYGNTYHTVSVEIDGKHVFTSPKEYGYDDQYLQTASDWLDKSGLVEPRKAHANGSHEGLKWWAERLGYTYSAIASDVARERDL